MINASGTNLSTHLNSTLHYSKSIDYFEVTMDNSNNLSLPYIAPSQAQKHVTHNEAIRKLDTLVMLAVEDIASSNPPSNPASGNRYIVAQTPLGEWQAHENEIASWVDNAWEFTIPQNGWLCWNKDESVLLVFSNNTWNIHGLLPDELDNIQAIGINTQANSTNRLTVAADSTLFTHQGSDHRLVLNKQNLSNTASVIFQNNYSARAELGLTGDDNFNIKISNDGSTFTNALSINKDTGIVNFENGVSGIINKESFGEGDIINTDYMSAKGSDLFTNGTGLLRNNYNYPSAFSVDQENTPNLPSSFYFEGYYAGMHISDEFLPVDPNRVYKLESYIYEAEYDHQQFMAMLMYDADKKPINSQHAMKYAEGGDNSQTTLAAPLSPGDTSISITDATGWNETSSATWNRGIIIFEYKNSFGHKYDHYSRLVAGDLFDLGDVDKAINVITLNKPFPSSLSNPDHPNGTWATGTKIANSTQGATYKYVFYGGLRVPTLGTWHRTESYLGGIDLSAQNYRRNFSPGCAFCKIGWLASYTHRAGGWNLHPDNGSNHKVWFAGVSVIPAQNANLIADSNGSKTINVARINASGQWDYLTNPAPIIEAV